MYTYKITNTYTGHIHNSPEKFTDQVKAGLHAESYIETRFDVSCQEVNYKRLNYFTVGDVFEVDIFLVKS
jgi:hypothetical protein